MKKKNVCHTDVQLVNQRSFPWENDHDFRGRFSYLSAAGGLQGMLSVGTHFLNVGDERTGRVDVIERVFWVYSIRAHAHAYRRDHHQN